jgi:hypothetical protein
VWRRGCEKTSKIFKTGLSGADVGIGTSRTLEDVACKDYICASFDVVGSVLSAVSLDITANNMVHFGAVRLL